MLQSEQRQSFRRMRPCLRNDLYCVEWGVKLYSLLLLATYYHCMMHTFNLCASQSVKVTYVRNCLDKVRELTSFFNTSATAKRHLLLDTIILQSADTDTFRQLCTTRFIERRRHCYSTGSFISSTAGFAENYNMGVQRCQVKCSLFY